MEQPIAKPPRTLRPDQDRDLPAYQAISSPLASLVRGMLGQGWTVHEAHFAMLTWATRRITQEVIAMDSPEAMAALMAVPEQVQEQIDFELATSRGWLPAIPAWR